jgi:NAD(P)-dependent dehydrogenase (short-subunit alcohol dehydrogenase family)
MTLRNQKALVTGAGSGIGRATALLLAQEGASVVLAGRRVEKLKEVAAEIEAAGGATHVLPTDLGDLESVRRLLDDVGDVDVLVNGAGIFPFADTASQTVEAFDELFAINVRGTYFLTSAILLKMAAKGSGCVITITSISGIKGMIDAGVYGATKAALASMTRSWSAEFARHGVRVNAIAPGYIQTDAVADIFGQDTIEELGRTRSPLERLGRPREVAEAVLFLVSSRSSYLTGVELAVDGGSTTRA